ncbi:Ubiquitin-conjugating enzyme E2 2 [Diplonema papillatum]|nr:Ubiquitin-conjugating enzyme E2 2 [Diplonema papillatum]
MAYSEKIQHESLRVAVCDVLDSVLNGKAEYFRPEIKREFLMRYETYCAVVDAGVVKDGQPFIKTPFEYPTNLSEGKFDYAAIHERLKKIRKALDDETEQWRQKGAELTKRKSYIASTLRDEHSRLLQDGMHGCSGGPVDTDNVFVWNLSIMQPEGLLEEGMFNVEIVFPESKDEYPRVRFKTKMFHPNISPTGYPCFNIPLAKHDSIDYLFTSIRKLLSSEPNPSTATWVNLEAADLCFSQDATRQTQWKRKVKQLARQSMEEPEF